MQDPFATLRELLNQPPSHPQFKALFGLFTSSSSLWDSPGDMQVALDYAQQHIQDLLAQQAPPSLLLHEQSPYPVYGLLPNLHLCWGDLYEHTRDFLALSQSSPTQRIFLRTIPPIQTYDHLTQTYRSTVQHAAQANHPNILRLLSAEPQMPYHAVPMEYVEGPNLRLVLNRLQKISPPQRAILACAIALQVANALTYAHQLTNERGQARPLYHAKLLPETVLLSMDGTVKVANFGMETVMRQLLYGGRISTPVTYHAPEFARGDSEMTAQADIFLLGVLLCELLTGQHPFQGKFNLEILRNIIDGKFTPPRAIEPQIPQELQDIAMQALQRAPQDRYASAQAMLRDLQDYLWSQHVDEPESLLREFLHQQFAIPAMLSQYAQLKAASALHETLFYFWDVGVHPIDPRPWDSAQLQPPRMNLLQGRSSHAEPLRVTTLLSRVWRRIRKQ